MNVVAGIGAAGLVTALALLISNRSLAAGGADEFFITLLLLGMAASGTIGWVILRRTGNTVGWLFLVFGAAGALWAATGEYLVHAFGVSRLPATTFVAIFGNAVAVAMVAPLTLVCLLFPTGSPPSPGWRRVLRASMAGTVCLVLWSVLRPGEIWSAPDRVAGTVMSPFSSTWLANSLLVVAVALLLGAGLAGVVSLVMRTRTAAGEERQQIRWLTLVAAIVAVLLLGQLATTLILTPFGVADNHTYRAISDGVFVVTVFLIVIGMPVAVAIAILKYRLYDIDVVIRKTLVFGVLAVFITGVYVAIVAGLSSRFSDTLALRIAATAIVAVAFQPVRDRANRFANRLVYGKRATPYEVLARFSERMGGTYASDDVLPRVARVIAEGTNAQRAEVWLLLGGGLFRMSAAWPSGDARESVAAADGELPSIEADRIAPVRHQGELLGTIAVTKPASEPLTPNEAELLDRLAEQAGLVLSNARLTADLEARLAQIAAQANELRASRQRIVAAQDEERRRLERNIHDGAQQHLVALAVKLRLAKEILSKDPSGGRPMLEQIRREVDASLDTLRSLALGIYPPLLEDQGIVAALAAQDLWSDVPVHLEADGVGRYPIELEAAVYFCTLEALQNATKYARATSIAIRLREERGALDFEIVDDGVGFDPAANGSGTGLQGMRDRLAVFGGDVGVMSAPGHGTVVHGRLPIPVEVTP